MASSSTLTWTRACAPSASVAQMVNAIAGDTKRILPVCAWATGQYGISDVYVGVPARLGRAGVEGVEELDLDADEMQKLRARAERLERQMRDEVERVHKQYRRDLVLWSQVQEEQRLPTRN